MKIVLLTLLVPNVVDQATEDTISASLTSVLTALDDANHSQPWFVAFNQNSSPVITLSTFARAAETKLLTVTIAADAVVRNVLFGQNEYSTTQLRASLAQMGAPEDQIASLMRVKAAASAQHEEREVSVATKRTRTTRTTRTVVDEHTPDDFIAEWTNGCHAFSVAAAPSFQGERLVWTVTRSTQTLLPLDGAIRRVLGARGSAIVSGSLNIRDPSSRY